MTVLITGAAGHVGAGVAGLAFAVWAAANLVPRARAHHRWYRKEFADYPSERKALIPLLW